MHNGTKANPNISLDTEERKTGGKGGGKRVRIKTEAYSIDGRGQNVFFSGLLYTLTGYIRWPTMASMVYIILYVYVNISIVLRISSLMPRMSTADP